jgi:hypothetical protein
LRSVQTSLGSYSLLQRSVWNQHSVAHYWFDLFVIDWRSWIWQKEWVALLQLQKRSVLLHFCSTKVLFSGYVPIMDFAKPHQNERMPVKCHCGWLS